MKKTLIATLYKYILFFLLCFVPKIFVAHTLNSQDQNIKLSFDLMEKKKWEQALKTAQQTNHPELVKIILSQKYLKSGGSFEDITQFLTHNPKWPQFTELAELAEKNITINTSSQLLKAWFDKTPPLTPVGHKFRSYAEIKEYLKNKTNIHDPNAKNIVAKIAKSGWINGEFNAKEQQYYLKRYYKVLTKIDHAKKVNLLLWQGKITEAKQLLYLLDNKHKEIFIARIAAIEQNIVSIKFHNDSGLLYEYLQNHIKNTHDPHKIGQLILHAPQDLENSDRWWKLKIIVIRELIEKQQYKDAFLIAAKHSSNKNEDKSDALWTAGWISFSFLNQPKLALKYLTKFYHSTNNPSQVSKAAYWLAKTYTKLGKLDLAHIWLKKAAAFPESFYGQLSIEYKSKVNQHSSTDKTNNHVTQALYLLHEYKKHKLVPIYLKSAISHGANINDIFNKTHYFQNLSKISNSKDSITRPNVANAPEQALIYAIIKQESAFNNGAISEKNARGLMQIRPGTAKDLAQELKVDYSVDRLTNDISYNLQLGTKFLSNLLQQFNGSYILALCAYNAGPGKAQEWIDRFGDPRKMNYIHSIVNWIELISYAQTREYVQKILANLQIYRESLDNHSKAKTLKTDLLTTQINLRR